MSVLSDALSALDYKDRENMKNEEEYTNVSIVSYSEVIEELLKDICLFASVNDIDVVIDFIDFDTADYEDVYVASIIMQDGEMHFNIEKALYDDEKYKEIICHKLYLDADSDEDLISSAFTYESDVEYFMIDESEEE
jgi:hypothetical protein